MLAAGQQRAKQSGAPRRSARLATQKREAVDQAELEPECSRPSKSAKHATEHERQVHKPKRMYHFQVWHPERGLDISWMKEWNSETSVNDLIDEMAKHRMPDGTLLGRHYDWKYNCLVGGQKRSVRSCTGLSQAVFPVSGTSPIS